MANRFDLVLFDFDGTLADSFPWFESVLNLLAERHRFRPTSLDELDVLRRGTALDAMRSLGIPRWRLPLIAAHFRRLMHDAEASIPLFAGASEMLETFVEAGVLLAVVSSNSERNVRRILGTRNASFVRHFACGAAIFGKARLFRRALRQTGIEPARALAVGDEIRDIDAARRAGIAAVAVTWGYTHPDALRAHGPEVVFDDFAEIVRFVL